METIINRVLETAKAEIEYLEKASNSQLDSKTDNAGYRNWNKYARDLDQTNLYNGRKNGFDWCDIFVDWCFVKAYGFENAVKMTYQKLKGAGAGCTFSMGWYRANNALFDYPQPGDQCFFSNDGWKTSYHTGLVESVEGDWVHTIEGNTSNSAGVIPNGGGVWRKTYPISWAKYGRPDYASYVPEEVEEMTGEEIYNKLNEYLREQPCPEWAKAELAEAMNLGITDGTRPCELIPRYQAAIMAKRAAGR